MCRSGDAWLYWPFRCFVATVAVALTVLAYSIPVRAQTAAGVQTGTGARAATGTQAQSQPQAAGQISRKNWGRVVAPVYGSGHPDRQGAERFPGPKQLSDEYFHAVLPNGRIVRPAGRSVQVGMNPLGARLTPDGRFLVVTNDDDESPGTGSLQNELNVAGYSLSVIDTRSMTLVSQISTGGRFFVGVQLTGNGPYTAWASGGGDNSVKRFTISTGGAISLADSVPIKPITPAAEGFVSNYRPGKSMNTADAAGNRPPAPSGFNRTDGAAITFPAGSALSPDRRFLYVACNGDNSLAVIDTATFAVVRQVPVGYFPYDVAVSGDGQWVFVSNWGVTEYKFAKPTYDPDGTLTALAPAGKNEPAGYFVPKADTKGAAPKSSSVSVISVPAADGARAALVRSVYVGEPLDELEQVGDAHPSAMALVTRAGRQYLYVVKSNSDSIGIIRLARDAGGKVTTKVRRDFDLSPLKVAGVKPPVHGAYPNAIVVSPDQSRAYVAEAGLNSVAVLDVRNPERPALVGRIPTAWYPTAVEVSADGKTLYVVNAKGIAEDLGPEGFTAPPSKVPRANALVTVDSNFIFGTAQQVDLATTSLDSRAVVANNFVMAPSVDDRIVPAGGAASRTIKHVFFILHENKTFDAMLGNLAQLGPFASLTYKDSTGASFVNEQYTAVAKNLQALASRFAVGVNYYSDAEESDAGHQFAASGTSSDYAEKTLENKAGRNLLTNKNMDAEDYPEAGYIFNNAARHGVTFKDYGALLRILGTDTGGSAPTTVNDPASGNAGYPVLPVTTPVQNKGDVDSPVQGLGQSYFMANPILAILGTKNHTGEPRLDRNYPGYNFNISDQRRAGQFIRDFDRMLAQGTLPQFVYIYQPNDHTGGIIAKNVTDRTPAMQVADGDVALGMVVEHIMRSPVYYDAKSGEGSAIFITFDDAQSTLDHIHPHRTPLVVVSPYAKPGPATRHYSTASIVKTEELLLGLPPGNLGDLAATDLRDMFQAGYNGVTADMLTFTRRYAYVASAEGLRIWDLVQKLDLSGPDADSRRLGSLARLSMLADALHAEAEREGRLQDRGYLARQAELYDVAESLVNDDEGSGGSGRQ
jgi:YVTN family beta-propeller protein